MRLDAHGIAADLPGGWEGAITAESQDLVAAAVAAGDPSATPPLTVPVAHFATFPLPSERDDFGGEVVARMGGDGVFVALLEYDPAEATRPLFAEHTGVPRRLDPRDFSARSLQRTLAGQVGLQRFFNAGGRAFCLYVVLGSGEDVHLRTRQVEQLLAGIVIAPRVTS